MRALLCAVLLAAACGPRPPVFTVGFDADSAARPGVATVGAGAGGVRFASYAAVLDGAAGVRYLSADAEPAAREMRAMAPVFSKGRPIPLPFEAPASGLRARAWTYRGRDYLVLLNPAKDRQWKVPQEALKPGWRPLFEARRDPRELLKNFQSAFYLRPYQVLVLESRLRPMRLLGRLNGNAAGG